MQGNFSFAQIIRAFFKILTSILIIRPIINLVLISLRPYLIILCRNIILLAVFIKSIGYINAIFFGFHIVYCFLKFVFILLLFSSSIFCYFCVDPYITLLFITSILYILTGICSLYISVILLENAFKAYLINNVFLLRLYLILSFFFFLPGIFLITYGGYIFCKIPWTKYGLIPLPTENTGTGPNGNGNGNGNPNPNRIFSGTETPEERRRRIYVLRRRSLFYHLKRHEKAKEKVVHELRKAQDRQSYYRKQTGFAAEKARQDVRELTAIKDTYNIRITKLNY